MDHPNQPQTVPPRPDGFCIGNVRISPPLALAPMAGHTDLVYRTLCKQFGCGIVYTELISAEGLIRNGKKTWEMIETTPEEQPLGVQIFGHNPETLAEAARMLEAAGCYQMIDLNMGCPVPKVVSRGAGAALMRNPSLVEKMVRAVADAVALPVTAKTRAGWSDEEINALEVCQAIENGGGKAVAIHARPRSRKHDGEPMLDLLAEIKGTLGIPVLGNGGIMTPEDALQMFDRTAVDAVMLGRGALGNPWIFQQILQHMHGEPIHSPQPDERRAVIEQHLRQTIWMFERRGFPQPEANACSYFRQQITSYVKGRRGARAVLRRMPEMVSAENILRILDEDLFSAAEHVESNP